MATFQNIYFKRTAATAKPCYMCYRPTTTVLATLNTTDFLYTCDGHLIDRGFATLIEPPPDDAQAAPSAKKVSDEEIRRVKEEYEERQRRKQEKAKDNDKGKDAEDSKGKEKDSSKSPVPTPKPTPPPPSPIPVPGSAAAAKPTHQRYILHRDVWAMRLAEHRKRRQTTAVKEVAPKLPITPRGGLS